MPPVVRIIPRILPLYLKLLGGFSYHAPQRGDRDLRVPQIRDGHAFVERASALFGLGYDHDGLLLNFPADNVATSLRIDSSFLTSFDLLMVTTRPPLDDESQGAKKRILRSHNSLENQVVAVLWTYFDVCSRDHINLSRNLAETLPTEHVNRTHITFR
jgi:hypothetical protein